jgi:hypothetical protein
VLAPVVASHTQANLEADPAARRWRFAHPQISTQACSKPMERFAHPQICTRFLPLGIHASHTLRRHSHRLRTPSNPHPSKPRNREVCRSSPASRTLKFPPNSFDERCFAHPQISTQANPSPASTRTTPSFAHPQISTQANPPVPARASPTASHTQANPEMAAVASHTLRRAILGAFILASHTLKSPPKPDRRWSRLRTPSNLHPSKPIAGFWCPSTCFAHPQISTQANR